MVGYRRHYVPGGTYFFTVTLKDRQSDLLVRRIDLLRKSFADVRSASPFDIVAVVVLPDHLHTIWRLPADESDFPNRWRALKAGFTRGLGIEDRRGGGTSLSPWQPRYWEHVIRDDRDLEHHIRYIHFNPVKHGLVRSVADWPYSSFHRYVAMGILPVDWAGRIDPDEGNYGE